MNVELLKTCIETLKELRTRMHETVEVSVIEELESVIDQLERLSEVSNAVQVTVDSKLRMRVLEIIASTVKAASNLSEIIWYFLNDQ